MEIKPLRSEKDYETAMARVEELWGAPPGTPASDELEILLALTGDYEKKHHAIEPPDPLAMLEHRLDQLGLTREEIDRVIRSRTRISKILCRESGLSPDVIRNLQDIPLEAFAADSG